MSKGNLFAVDFYIHLESKNRFKKVFNKLEIHKAIKEAMNDAMKYKR